MAYIIFILIAAVSFFLQNNFQRKFKKYSRLPLSRSMTGKEIAEKMLHDNGIYDVKVQCANGILSDHYNPANKTVNLSQDVYATCSIAAAAAAIRFIIRFVFIIVSS